jgi:hypothetical protein
LTEVEIKNEEPGIQELSTIYTIHWSDVTVTYNWLTHETKDKLKIDNNRNIGVRT